MTDTIYTSFLFFYPYNKCLELYYNNFYKCIENNLDDSVIKSTTIFEKSQIKWVCIDNLGSLKVRPFYKKIVKQIDSFIIQNWLLGCCEQDIYFLFNDPLLFHFRA